MPDYTGDTNKFGNAIGIPFSSFATDDPGMIDLAFAADDVTKMNDMFWLDGIRQDSADWNDGDGAVRWSNGFNVIVRPFRGHVNGTIVFAPQITLTIDAEPASERVDSVIIRRDYDTRTVDVTVLKGTSGSTEPPALTYNAFGVAEYELAHVRVTNTMSALSQSDITDARRPLFARMFSERPTPIDVGRLFAVDAVGGAEVSAVTTQMVEGKLDTAVFDVSQQIMHVRDEKPSGTNGGTFTAGAWRTRDLNTVATNTIPGASLNNNQITLPPGQYVLSARAPTRSTGESAAQIVNATSGVVLLSGASVITNTSYVASVESAVWGVLTLPVTTTLSLQHYCKNTMATNGFGHPTAIAGKNEVYAEVIIRRLT